MKNYLIFFLAFVVLMGCDNAKNFAAKKMQSGTLKGYLQCIEDNEEEVSVLGYKYVQSECANKHSKESNGKFTNQSCKAYIHIGVGDVSKPYVSFSGCLNNKNIIITSIMVGIDVKNVPNKKNIRILSKYENVFVKPNEQLEAKIYIDSPGLGRFKTYPFCSDETDEMCKSWFIEKYKYIPANI